MASPSDFTPICSSVEHNDGGANCFISNNITHFVSYLPQKLSIRQLDGSTATASGFGLKLIQHSSGIVLPLWPTYFMPSQQQCTFSPTALKYYLKLPSVQTHHLDTLHITTTTGTTITFPSIPTYI
jgi:hypothetical protein